ncbi:phospholipase [Shinella sp. WSJ-2]|uniref:phospholipase D-like domain-containing protein n=1 Tax=Shinella sp. WSJ-2 TaxID=2303749 RepID=UPI000E3C5B55|nr:phospholipase D-like domain-containing protein [Shinella sp. WSJ-2]RFZ83894.1 phospholipase [Shinella sp. WSJ-2]
MSEGSLFRPGHNCWRTSKADDFSIIVDADDYFTAIRDAMRSARRSIFLVGWDFDAGTTLGRPDIDDGAPQKVGEFIIWLARKNPDLEIRILLWSPALLASWMRPSNLPYLLRWKWHPRISVKLDGKHPVGSSHHQKMLVVDDDTAFCGGIDVTLDRWDTRDHLDENPRRRRPNGSPYGPWHDASSRFTGEAARALGELCHMRWRRAGGAEVSEPSPRAPVKHAARSGFSFGSVNLAITRTEPAHLDESRVIEIEKLYVDMIAAARKLVYAESQYFASRKVAQAIAQRLAEPDGPEIVLVNPFASDNWLGALAMDTARARLRESLRRHDLNGRFRMYHPVTALKQPIYVHSKLMIVDNEIIRVGSSNMNNRSMRFDRECDVALEAGNSEEFRRRIGEFRTDLLAEHLGVSPGTVEHAVAQSGSLIAAIETLRKSQSGRTLVPYKTAEVSDLEKWLADNEILDPEGPEEVFEPIERRGLFRGRLHLPHRRRKHLG